MLAQGAYELQCAARTVVLDHRELNSQVYIGSFPASPDWRLCLARSREGHLNYPVGLPPPPPGGPTTFPSWHLPPPPELPLATHEAPVGWAGQAQIVPAEQLPLFQQLWSDFRLSTRSWCPVATNVRQLQSIEDETETVHCSIDDLGLHALANANVDS